MTNVIVITAKRNGFRRCGIAHKDKPTTWLPGDFTSEQWRELIKEPQLVITCMEMNLDFGREQPHALTSSAALPEAPNTAQNVQSKTLEAGATALGNGVLLPVTSIAGNLDSLWDDALLEDQEREVAKAQAAASVELNSAWEDALLEDQAHEAAKVQAAKMRAKPGRTKADKE